MCWKGKSSKKIAKRDIEVYKVLYKHEDKYVPYYQSDDLAYEVGKLYKQKMNGRHSYDGFYMVSIGFHSYSMERTYVKRRNSSCSFGLVTYRIYTKMGDKIDVYFDDKYNTIEVTNGFLSNETTTIKDEVHFVKCIIPKGAEYFENEDGEIVSNMIIVRGDEMCKVEFEKFNVDE